MALVPAKCTNCGANINIDNTNEAGICEFCGTAFITEKAINNYNVNITNNNIIIGSTINVTNVTNTDNLYVLARRYRETGNYKDAIQNYELILKEDPDSWEAYFYHIYLKSASASVMELIETENALSKNLPTVYKLINLTSAEDRMQFVSEVANACLSLTTMHYKKVSDIQAGTKKNAYKLNNQDLSKFIKSVSDLCFETGDILEECYGASSEELILKSWKQGVSILCSCYTDNGFSHFGELGKVFEHTLDIYTDKIKKCEPDYYNSAHKNDMNMSGFIQLFKKSFVIKKLLAIVFFPITIYYMISKFKTNKANKRIAKVIWTMILVCSIMAVMLTNAITAMNKNSYRYDKKDAYSQFESTLQCNINET